MCCMRLAESTGCKKSASAHHHSTLSDYIFANKACIDNRKTNLLKSNISSMSPQYGELQPTSGWDQLPGLGQHHSNFNGFRVLASLLHRCRSTEVNQTLHNVWPSHGLVHYTLYTGTHFRALAPDRILPGAKFTLHPSLAFSYIDSVTAWHQTSGR